MHEIIVELAKSMASPSEAEETLLDKLCAAAEAELAGRLRQGVRAEDCADAFCCAAALLAVSAIVACRDAGGAEQFSVGEVSIRTGAGTSARADTLRRQASALLLPFQDDDDFAFWGVPG
jgi:hypothetical protein